MEESFFDRLPPEMILKIFSFVPTADLMTSTRFICKRFNVLLNDKTWWITRIQKERGVHISEIEANSPTFNAPQSFEECLREEKRWNKFVYSDLKVADGHISTVDAIRLFRTNGQRYCISGSRDRSMKIWDLKLMEEGGSAKQWEIASKESAHSGWIWYIDTPREGKFVSSGWDEYVKEWQIQPAGITELGNCKLQSAITSSILMDCGLVACSTYTKQICFVDMSDAPRIVKSCSFHRGPIFTMDVQGNYVYSGGEDRQLVVTDVRNPAKPVMFMKTSQDHTTTISVNHGLVVCGTYKGSVKIYNPTDMAIVSSYKAKPCNRIRQVKHNRGSIIAMCKTQLVKIFTSGTKGTTRAQTQELGEPSRFDYLKGDFVICGGMGSIMFWPCPNGVG